MRPAVLFSSVCKPYDKMIGRFLPSDQMGNALTRGQDLFVMYEHTHFNPLHLMAQNVTGPSVVLEYPTMEQFARELEEGYDYVCISANVNNLERLLEMCACTREKSPHSKIVVGGYGVLCTPILFEQPEWEGKIDEVCRGEGIGFMRDLLGTPADMEQQCRLPNGGF